MTEISRTAFQSAGLVVAMGLGAFAVIQTLQGQSFDARVEQALLDRPDIMIRVFEKLERQRAEKEAAAAQDQIADLADDLFAGLDPARPILIELMDYNCGYCRRAHGTVEAIRTANPDLQYVRIETPILGAASRLAAEVALTVKATHGHAAYDRLASALMTSPGPVNPGTLQQILEAEGFVADTILERARAGAADADLAEAARIARRLGATGTPVFVGPSGMVRGAGSGAELLEIAAPAPAPT
ncbi:DsbA family protein [Chachezhania sediminis]|uniref:DsbA family protein n=1 Tax=Chachezhania sediminis TaxID=2599291 RepID=UPI00131DB430|nr:DsbA family protein [Chachezhania sediminis]